MNEFRADLHCHSTCSDGSLTPAEIVSLAKQVGLSALSITDHDTVEAYASAAPLCLENQITLISGVEFSTQFEETSIHILGYGFDPDHPAITQLCARHTERRRQRNLEILSLLSKHGMDISEDDLTDAASAILKEKRHSIGRPHIALAMVKKTYVESVQEAFKKYIGDGRPCFARGMAFSIQETIDTIHQAKGVAIIAHPHLIAHPHIVNALLEMNFDGIECYYGTFSTKDNARWLKIARKKEWLITGGSDFHGDIKPNITLGRSWIGEEHFNALQNRLK